MLSSRLESQFGVTELASLIPHMTVTYSSSWKFAMHYLPMTAMTQCVFGVPRESIFGSPLFIAYVSPAAERPGVYYRQFSDETQLLVAMNADDAAPDINKFADFSGAVQSWFLKNDLQLNVNKSEVVILDTTSQLRLAAVTYGVDVAGSKLQVAPKLKSLVHTADTDKTKLSCLVRIDGVNKLCRVLL